VLPVVPIAIANLQRDRTAQRVPAAHARQNLRAVPLDSHAPAASVAELSSAEIGIEQLGAERQPRRHAFDDHDERGAVRLACCKKSKHATAILSKFLQRPGRDARKTRTISPGVFLALPLPRVCRRVRSL
jgi:hypothetical protein